LAFLYAAFYAVTNKGLGTFKSLAIAYGTTRNRKPDWMTIRWKYIARFAAPARSKSSASSQKIATIVANTTKNKPDVSCFFEACAGGDRDVVRQLLSDLGNQIDLAKMDPVSGQTAFHQACSGGHVSIIHQLINKFGSETCNNLANRDGKTALEVAAEAGGHALIRNILTTVSKKQAR